MLLKRPTLAGLAALAALTVPSVAGAEPRFTPIGEAIGPVVTDGVRYAAYEPAAGVTRILDTQQETQFDVATPCDVRYGLGVASVGGGAVMWKCFAAFDGPVLDIASRTVSKAAKPTPPFRPDYGEVQEIGARWILHSVEREGKGRDLLVTDWRTGQTLREPGGKADALDLDDPRLVRRMCDPLRRTVSRSQPRRYAAYQYEPPYGLRTRRGALVLERCGAKRTILSPRPKRLGPPFPFVTEARLAGGIVTWTDGTGYLRVFVAASGRRTAVRLPRRGSGGPVTRTLTRLFASLFVQCPNGPAQPYCRWKIYGASWRPLAGSRPSEAARRPALARRRAAVGPPRREAQRERAR